MMFFVGAEVRSYPRVLSDKTFHMGSIQINMQQIYIIAIAIALMILLQFIVHKTKTGKAMRAVSIDPDAAQLMGSRSTRRFRLLLLSVLLSPELQESWLEFITIPLIL